MAVLHKVSAGSERPPIAACERNTSIARVEDIAIADPVTASSLDHNTALTDIADQTSDDEIAYAIPDFQSVPARGFHHHSGKRDVRHIGHLYEGSREQRKDYFIGGIRVFLRSR